MALAKIIKYEGDNQTFIWKSPIVNFNTMSQLIVHESQEAIFFKNGQALDVFEAGKYTLSTDNIPIIRRFLSIPTGGRTPFQCEVFFVNKTQQMAIKWGTDSQVQYMDPLYKFPLQIGLSGEMALSVSDSRRLLVKLVGTEKSLTQESLMMKFRAVLNSKVKPYIASVMQSANYSIFEADAHMEEFSDALKDKLKDDFDDYGVSLDRFFVTNIAKPEGDYAYEQYKDIHVRKYTDVAQAQLKQQLEIIEQQTQAQKIVIESQAIAQKRAQEGYTYQQERGFDVSEKIAENEAVGEFTNLGVGFGTMAGIGGAVGGMVGGMVNDSINSSIAKPSNEGNELDTFKSKIEKLKIMKECGLLSDDEFIAKKQELLNEL